MKSESRQRTPDEQLAISQMRWVTFPPCSWDKRFYRDLTSGSHISEKQAAQLWRLFIRYRRQMEFPAKDKLLKIAEVLAAPDFRKEQAKARELRRLKEYSGVAQ